MKKEVFMTGAAGLVGSRVKELFKDKYDILSPTEEDLDITNVESLKTFFTQNKPNVVINLAAYTNVNEAENQTGDQESISWKVNVEAVKNIINALSEDTHLIQISTDMVFTGSQDTPGPYKEDSPLPNSPDKLTWYGWTKNRGEKLVSDSGHTVVRIIYPVRSSFERPDYIRFPLRKYREGNLHPLFKDQQVSITFIDQLATALENIIDNNHKGIFHVCSSNIAVPINIVKYALEKLGESTKNIKESSIVEYLSTLDNKYRYHVKGGLDNKLTQEKLGIKFSTWQEIIDTLVEQGLTIENA